MIKMKDSGDVVHLMSIGFLDTAYYQTITVNYFPLNNIIQQSPLQSSRDRDSMVGRKNLRFRHITLPLGNFTK